MLAVTEKPLIVQANAGLPHVEHDCTVFDIGPEEYAAAVRGMVDDGVGILGGCCGTDPRHIALIADVLRGRTPRKREVPQAFTVTSAQALISLPTESRAIAVIGERINPTGKKRLKEALRTRDFDYLVSEGIAQQEQGADILDVNVGLPDIDEVDALQVAGERLSGAVTLPLQFDSTVPAALEAAVRRYPGKPIINSVNGKQESWTRFCPSPRDTEPTSLASRSTRRASPPPPSSGSKSPRASWEKPSDTASRARASSSTASP